MENIKWLRENGFEWESLAIAEAAKNGDIPMMTWLHESGCELDHYAYDDALDSNNMQVLEWLNEHECPKHIDAYRKAIDRQDIAQLNWLKDYNFPKHNSLLCYAGSRATPEILDWLCSNEIVDPLHIKKKLKNSELTFKRFGCLQWFYEHGYIVKPSNFKRFVGDGLETAKWLTKVCTFLDVSVFNAALDANNFEVIQYLRDIGCPWDETSYQHARTLDVLKWLMLNGCPYNEEVLGSSRALFCDDYMEALEWVEKKGCEWGNHLLYDLLKNGKNDAVQWLMDKNIKTCSHVHTVLILQERIDLLDQLVETFTENMWDHAIAGSKLKSLEWLFSKKCPISSTISIVAVQYGNLKVLKWLKEKNLLQPIDEDSRSCITNKVMEKWLIDNGYLPKTPLCVVM
jgi:hypothetical protein